jgi:hypothetical protein
MGSDHFFFIAKNKVVSLSCLEIPQRHLHRRLFCPGRGTSSRRGFRGEGGWLSACRARVRHALLLWQHKLLRRSERDQLQVVDRAKPGAALTRHHDRVPVRRMAGLAARHGETPDPVHRLLRLPALRLYHVR